MSTSIVLERRELQQRHVEALNLAALAQLLSETAIHYRHVDERDRNAADLGAVADLLAQQLAAHRDALERMDGAPVSVAA